MSLRTPTALPKSVRAAEPERLAPPTRLSVTPPTTTRAPSRPTAVHGIERKTWNVSPDALRLQFAGIEDATLEAVQRVLANTEQKPMAARDASSWGLAVQQAYAQCVQNSLALEQSLHKAHAIGHLHRLQNLLQDISEATQRAVEPGLLAHWRQSPSELLQEHSAEIEQLRKLLGALHAKLAAHGDALMALRDQMALLAQNLQAHALAAAWLANQDARAGQTLLGRASELTQAHVQALDSLELQTQARASVQTLMAAITQGVLLRLPAWLEQATHAGQPSPHWTPTQARSLLQDLGAVMRTLSTH